MTPGPRSPLRHTLLGALLAVALCVTPAIATPASARSAAPEVMTRNQQIVVNQVNNARTSRRRGALPTNGYMNQKAMRWAAHLVSCQCLEHRQPPYGVPRGWCAAAENVGRSGDGGTLSAVHKAFMASDGHRENILNTRWTDLGVGVARDRAGEYFVVHVFADYSC